MTKESLTVDKHLQGNWKLSAIYKVVNRYGPYAMSLDAQIGEPWSYVVLVLRKLAPLNILFHCFSIFSISPIGKLANFIT